MVRNLLCVMLGGAVGSALRYLTSLAFQSIKWLKMPWGTFIVNLTGCLLLGLLLGLGERYTSFPKEIYLMLTVGLCGSYTTFSTFSKESMMMLQSGNYWLFAVYTLLSVLAGIALVAAGYYLSK